MPKSIDHNNRRAINLLETLIDQARGMFETIEELQKQGLYCGDITRSIVRRNCQETLVTLDQMEAQHNAVKGEIMNKLKKRLHESKGS